ncbi:MAG: glycosyltransferase [Clostridium sp.]|nr:glycosyltransferase [Clostridium sp.]
MFLSVIIPAYNAASFLERCVRSCLKQDLLCDNYELIIVNDGSSDFTQDVITRVCHWSPNISYITQDNQGLSMARNAGMRIAQGDYILFLDADDWIEENCLSILADAVVSHDNPEMVRFNACNTDGTNIRMRTSYEHEHETVGRGAYVWTTNIGYVCATSNLYKRSFLEENKLFFMPHVLHEDCEFTPRAFWAARSVLTLNVLVYHVFQNPNSITRTVNSKRSFDLVEIAKTLSVCNNTLTESIRVAFNEYICILINNAMYPNRLYSQDDQKKLVEVLLKNRFLFKYLCESKTLKYRLEGFLFRLFPKQCLHIYNLMKYRRL